MNPLLQFAMTMTGAILKALVTKATPALLGIAKEVANVTVELVAMELSTVMGPETKRNLEKDVESFFAEAWQVILQEGLLLADDLAGLMALAAWQQIKGLVGMNNPGPTPSAP